MTAAAQAARTAARRTALLATGTVPAEGTPPAALTVVVDGKAVAPTFQLDAAAAVGRELALILAVPRAAGVRPWTVWTWLATPTGLLSGGVPERLAAAEPGRVQEAARRFAEGCAA